LPSLRLVCSCVQSFYSSSRSPSWSNMPWLIATLVAFELACSRASSRWCSMIVHATIVAVDRLTRKHRCNRNTRSQSRSKFLSV
jgi:hypothetical protein